MNDLITTLQNYIEKELKVTAVYIGSVSYSNVSDFRARESKEFSAYFFRLTDFPKGRYCVVNISENISSLDELQLVFTDNMPGFAFDELTEKLGQLSPETFENFIFELIQRSGEFRTVESQVSYGKMFVDIEAENLVGEKVFFEIKRNRLAHVDLIQNIVDRKKSFLDHAFGAHFILVLTGKLSPAAQNLSQEENLTIWDIEKITELMLKAPDIEERFLFQSNFNQYRTVNWATQDQIEATNQKKA